jgi:hypothetical protein
MGEQQWWLAGRLSENQLSDELYDVPAVFSSVCDDVEDTRSMFGRRRGR